MNREIMRCSDGYWNLINETGTVICRFKRGDKVRVLHFINGVGLPHEGIVNRIEFSKTINIVLDIKTIFGTEYVMIVPIDDIYKMETKDEIIQ